MVLRDGALSLPAAAGMGMALDDAKIRKFTVKA
jgi:hypothetical protein